MLAMLALAGVVLLSCSACATPANRRAAYTDAPLKGPWTDLAKKQEQQSGATR